MARVAPPLLDDFTDARSLSARSLAEVLLPEGAEILVMELVISLPAPKMREPLELAVLFAVPTMLFATPEYAEDEVADSMLFREPVMVAPKFLLAAEELFPS
ncbi:hypothetical protein ACSZOP_07875 [Colibacter massiliensis]|uniref:hypothetical protein n=1 Tax=Colibacter massiliensis TaxID=1852379 RepID=UPI003F8EBE9D